jgi:hypothetical protein
MTFKLTIEMDNAAFNPEPAEELARILNQLAEKIRETGDVPTFLALRDINGNSVGVCQTGKHA